jgi:outer membrane biosynthesis protein TonB
MLFATNVGFAQDTPMGRFNGLAQDPNPPTKEEQEEIKSNLKDVATAVLTITTVVAKTKEVLVAAGVGLAIGGYYTEKQAEAKQKELEARIEKLEEQQKSQPKPQPKPIQIKTVIKTIKTIKPKPQPKSKPKPKPKPTRERDYDWNREIREAPKYDYVEPPSRELFEPVFRDPGSEKITA